MRLRQKSAVWLAVGMMLAGWPLPADAQQPATAAAAAETRPNPSQSPTQKEPGWLERQWAQIVALFTAGAERGRAPAGAVAGPQQITVSQPAVRDVIEWDEYTGRFDAVDTVDVRVRVSGFLTKVHFVDGQMVQQGDLLFTIDKRPFEQALVTARAELEQANTKVESASKDVVRGKPLVDRRVISEKVYDDRENLLREAQAAVKVAEAKAQAAELDLSFAEVRAPLAGRIGRNLVSVGNYVTGGAVGASAQTLLASIVTQDPIQFYFDVSENNVIKYKRIDSGVAVGQPGAVIEVAIADDKGFPHRGKLDFADNRLDATTGTLRLRALLDNKQGLFSPGMFGRARIAGSASYRGVLLPDEAVGTDQASKYVAVVGDDGVVTRRVVTLGPLQGSLRVIRSGVAETDWVVVKGLVRVRPGQKVVARREALQAANVPAGAMR